MPSKDSTKIVEASNAPEQAPSFPVQTNAPFEALARAVLRSIDPVGPGELSDLVSAYETQREPELPRSFSILLRLAGERGGPHEAPEFELTAEPPAPTVSKSDRLEAMREERDRLRIQNQLLESRVAEEQRRAVRETQRFDQVQAEFGRFLSGHRELLDQMHGRAKANDALQGALISREGGRLRMFETYEGVVKHVGKDSVVVRFEVDGDLVEHTYERKQFIEQRLPKRGDRLAACVLVAELPPKDDELLAEIASEAEEDDYPGPPKRVIRGPHEI